ncbi:MAG TPA: MEDS domain-containing protein [bacterium]
METFAPRPSSGTLADLRPGDHACCVYATEDDHRRFLTAFIRDGLARGEKILYIVEQHNPLDIVTSLQDAGVELEQPLAREQFGLVTADGTYLRQGRFDPERMIALFRDEVRRAVGEGYHTFRGTGEMSWSLRAAAGADRLIEYESLINAVDINAHALLLCQYDRRCFGAERLLETMAVHPLILLDGGLYRNPLTRADDAPEAWRAWLDSPESRDGALRREVASLLTEREHPV